MKKTIAILICALMTALSASADYLQIADEAQNDELRTFIYDSGTAADTRSETKRLYIYNYLLLLEEQKSDYAQSFCSSAYEAFGKREAAAFLSRRAYEYAENSNEIQNEVDKNEAYLERLNSEPKNLSRAEALAAENADGNGAGVRNAISFIIAAAVLVGVLALFLLEREKSTDRLFVRDAKRFARRVRVPALLLGVFVGAGCFVLAGSRTTETPSVDGEYIAVAEELLKYCEAEPKSLTKENVKKYELSAALGEILNNRVAKNLDELKADYAARASRLRLESRGLENKAWQAYNNALNGSETDFAATAEKYVELGIEAGEKLIDAQYCENIVLLMEKSGETDENAETKTAELLSAAVEKLACDGKSAISVGERVLLAAVGFAATAILFTLIAAALGFLRLVRIKKRTDRLVGASSFGKQSSNVSFRG